MKNIRYAWILCLLVSCKPTTERPVDKVDAVEDDTGEGYSFYVGTYTGVIPIDQGGSQGIYKYKIDGNGLLSSEGLVVEVDNPSYIALANNGQHLIAVSEVNTNNGNGTVLSYEVVDDSKLQRISSQSSGGAHPCHIAVDDDGQVLVSNYTGGNVALLTIDHMGKLQGPRDIEQHTGKGIHERQGAPHAHSAWFRPGGRGVISADLGTNDLWVSHIRDGRLVPATISRVPMAEGAGPRHIAFHPSGRFIYVVNELDNTVGLIHVVVDGSLTVGETYTTLPDGYDEFTKTADIHVSADGRYVYASNRGHNSLAIYAIDDRSGSLSLTAIQSVRGEEPRNFQLTPDDKYIVVANQNSNSLVAFERNMEEGTLKFTSEISAPTPVCIVF